MRAAVTKEVLSCLKTCQQAGEMMAKGKHQHALPEVGLVGEDNLQLSVYWSRKSVGLKKWDKKANKWNQVVYFSRDSPCCGTNLVLAKYWVPRRSGRQLLVHLPIRVQLNQIPLLQAFECAKFAP